MLPFYRWEWAPGEMYLCITLFSRQPQHKELEFKLLQANSAFYPQGVLFSIKVHFSVKQTL